MIRWLLMLTLLSMLGWVAAPGVGAQETLDDSQEAAGPIYPTRVYRAGEPVQEAKGFLIHPARFREMRVLLLETLPRCELDLTRCEQGWDTTPDLTACSNCPTAPSSSWSDRLQWTATGVGIGVALGTLVLVVVGVGS